MFPTSATFGLITFHRLEPNQSYSYKVKILLDLVQTIRLGRQMLHSPHAKEILSPLVYPVFPKFI